MRWFSEVRYNTASRRAREGYPLRLFVGVWNDSLFVTFSDNGGQPDLTYGGGRNDPLRGGKVRFRRANLPL